ncbi:MAG: DoxX family protein [Chitinophagaceae bacterium]|nr:MAG: DoxX family protein [Chitinophagaceae bacterium]
MPFIILRILLGVFFIVSGSLKVHPIEFFEFSFVEIGISSLTFSTILARLLIGLEFLVGFFLITSFQLKKTLIFSIGLVIFLSIYIIYLAFTEGLTANCGCMGEHFQLTPLVSLSKNILIVALLVLLIKKHPFKPQSLLIKWISISAILPAFVLPFILNPVNAHSFNPQISDFEPYAFKNEILVDYPFFGSQKPDIESGQYIVPVLLAGCRFCKIALHKIALMDKNNDLPSIFVISSGEADYTISLMEEAGIEYPLYEVNSNNIFVINGARSFPGILLLDNGIVKYRWTGSTFQEKYVLKVLETYLD